MKLFYVMEMNGFTEDNAEKLLSVLFRDVNWGKGQNLKISHLTEKGVNDLKKHVLKEGGNNERL